jgi:hypothetical protein
VDTDPSSIKAATARQALAGRQDVIEVRVGIDFRRLITDERVVVVGYATSSPPQSLKGGIVPGAEPLLVLVSMCAPLH